MKTTQKVTVATKYKQQRNFSYKRPGDIPHSYIKINTLNHSLVAKKKLSMTHHKPLNKRHSKHFKFLSHNRELKKKMLLLTYNL